MQFILTGFTPDGGFRVFAFEGIAADHTRTVFTVRADLALTHIHGIRMQELPLLCRELLERGDESQPEHNITFSEENMRAHAEGAKAVRDAALKKKAAQRPPTRPPANPAAEATTGVASATSASPPGMGWRLPQR